METKQLVEVAKLYYQQNLGQDEIARLLDISRSTVSRALRVARERGMVRVTIVSPSSNAFEMEEWLRRTYQLEHVTIVAAVGDLVSDTEAAAQAAASFLDHVLPATGALGVAAGRTAMAVSQQARTASRPGLTVVPVMGGWVSSSSISANEVARTLAERWGARSEALFAPAFVSHEQAREALLSEEGIRRPLTIARQADVVCVSVAPMAPLSKHWRMHHTSISSEDARHLSELGAVGETCAQFLTEEGIPLDEWNLQKTIALSIAEFRAIPKVVMVAAGADKALALMAACRAGFVNALIVTEDLAVAMRELEDNHPGMRSVDHAPAVSLVGSAPAPSYGVPYADLADG